MEADLRFSNTAYSVLTLKSCLLKSRVWFTTHRFESSAIVIFLVYVFLRFTPSSYSLALQLLGAEDDGLLYGNPRPIKSDEWTTGTPEIIARILHPDVATFYHYLPNLLNDPLPHNSFRVIFQPLSWGFFVNPTFGYSLYFAFAFLIGILSWPAVFRLLGMGRNISIIGGLTIMFSPFIIGWFTHRPGIYGVLPLLIYVFLRNFKNVLYKFITSLWIGIAYLETTFYPPETILSIFFVIVLIQYRGEIKKYYLGYFTSIFAFAIAGIFYFEINKAIWETYSSTLYPGSRTIESGLLPFKSLVTQFLPFGYGQSYILNYAPSNELESATFASVLLVSVIFLSRGIRRVNVNQQFIVIVLPLLILSAYESLNGLDFFGRFFLLDKVPPNRTLFLSGLLITFLSLHLLSTLEFRVTKMRLLSFFLFLLILYILPTLRNRDDQGNQLIPKFYNSDVFISLATLLIAILVLRVNIQKIDIQKVIVLVSLPLWIVSAHWNPIASSQVFFKKIDSPIVSALEDIRDSGPSGKIAVYGFPGQILSGAGFTSLTDRPGLPDLKLLKEMFPSISIAEFNYIFNRVAEIRINPDQFNKLPELIQPNLITVPISEVSKFASTVTPLKIKPQNQLNGMYSEEVFRPSYIDRIQTLPGECTIVGWLQSKDTREEISIYYPTSWVPYSASRTLRPDVLRAVAETGLYSGIEISFKYREKINSSNLLFEINNKIVANWNIEKCSN